MEAPRGCSSGLGLLKPHPIGLLSSLLHAFIERENQGSNLSWASQWFLMQFGHRHFRWGNLGTRWHPRNELRMNPWAATFRAEENQKDPNIPIPSLCWDTWAELHCATTAPIQKKMALLGRTRHLALSVCSCSRLFAAPGYRQSKPIMYPHRTKIWCKSNFMHSLLGRHLAILMQICKASQVGMRVVHQLFHLTDGSHSVIPKVFILVLQRR